MSNSPLVEHTRISPNTWGTRTHKIDTITIHCVVGQCTAESLGEQFAKKSRKASSNYGVDKNGRVGMYVEEHMASQCSSNKANDNRAVTIEVASDTTHPYAITPAAYKTLVKLVADIAKRNEGIGELKWKGDKALIGKTDKQNITVHRWFANKACPGDYIYERLGQIATEANAINKVSSTKPAESAKPPEKGQNGSILVKVDVGNLNIRKGPGTNYAKVGKYVEKGVYTITEVKSGSGSKSGWGKLKSGAGWISLDYVKKM